METGIGNLVFHSIMKFLVTREQTADISLLILTDVRERHSVLSVVTRSYQDGLCACFPEQGSVLRHSPTSRMPGCTFLKLGVDMSLLICTVQFVLVHNAKGALGSRQKHHGSNLGQNDRKV
jgi:hypothetical protein